MASVDDVIERFGGQSALARAIGKGPSTVQYWSKAGRIPAKWHPRLLEIASGLGIRLDPSDLVPLPILVGGDDQSIAPVAKWWGALQVGANELPCFVLSDGRRVISRSGATRSLAGRGSANLESYLRVAALRDYLPANFSEQMIEFVIGGVTNKTVRGITAETFIDICTAYVRAADEGALQTARQQDIARQASVFLAACAKVGLLALIDEATGYQFDRAEDALQVKLRLFLAEEMRKWEKTFPDELWTEFGRLTNWHGTVTQRPKYWGKLVMELVYGYLDPDVADWLRKNAPKPRSGQNYHQWLTDQYGLKRLTEHLWMLIGVASACSSMPELRQRMAERYGKQQVQFTLFIDPPKRQLPPSI